MADASLILASQSPRRKELLARLGIPFTTQPADVDETERAGESPLDYVQRIARAKAAKVAAANPGACIIAADTPVICGGEILQSPSTPDEAAAMLRKQSGRRVQVPTVVVVQTPGGEVLSATAEGWCDIKVFSGPEIAAYVAHEDEWKGISGAFKVQGMGAVFITGMGGTASCIMGLPLYETAQLLRRAGYTILGC